MPFHSELQVRQDETDPSYWLLDSPLEYEGKFERFTVPVDSRTNFASVPRPFWWLFPRSDRYSKATVLHDFFTNEEYDGDVSRCDADGIFRRSLREAGVPAWRRWLMWGAVRIGGGPFGCGLRQLIIVIALALLMLPFVVVTLSSVAVLIVLFYLTELATFYILRRFRPEALRPTLRLWS